jgi:hypothetical protein
VGTAVVEGPGFHPPSPSFSFGIFSPPLAIQRGTVLGFFVTTSMACLEGEFFSEAFFARQEGASVLRWARGIGVCFGTITFGKLQAKRAAASPSARHFLTVAFMAEN